jgi:tRNA(adenine34) deaminase
MQSTDDEKYMRLALQEAEEALRCDEIPIGCVIVSEGRILGRGHNLTETLQDVTAHAEMQAITAAAGMLGGKYLQGCTLYVTVEPCVMCAGAIGWAQISRVVYGAPDDKRGFRTFAPNALHPKCTVTAGVLENECRELNKRFLCLHEKHRPYIILKWAQTADGFIDKRRTNTACPENAHLKGALAISTPETKKLVHKMRAENMAIMVGTNTVLMDNPRLLNTHWEGRNPIRITLDRHNKIPADARIFSDETETIVYRGRTDWPFITADLASRNIHSVLVEGGTTLLNHIIETGIWDEMHIEVAPELSIGDGIAAPNVQLPETFETIDGHRMYTINH